MNHHIRKIITALLLIIFFASCAKENACDCIKRTGPILFEKRELSGFDQLFVDDNLNVFITQDSVFEVIIEAGKNVRGRIKTDVSDGVLTIKNANRCNWARSYKEPYNVYIRMPIVKYITSNGTGNIKSLNTITTNELDVQTKNSGNIELTINNSLIKSHMHGAGDITLHGSSNQHFCDIGGTAFLKCQDLQTQSTYLHTFSTGICYVSASNTISCKIDRIGDVNCYGNPIIVEKTGTGSGQLYIK